MIEKPNSIMKFRGRKVVGSDSNLRLPIVFFLCFCFFLAGLFGSIILSQDVNRSGSRHRYLQQFRHEFMVHGETGESSLTSIPFQVLSWRPRAVYFPKFATGEECERFIELAKTNLKPSSLVLRKGETLESTKDVRTSSGTFISASEDSSKVVDLIEQKIARVTMIPQSHGEDFNVLRYELGQKYASHYDSSLPSEYTAIKTHRVASFLLYLSDIEEGGETMFPFENGSNMDRGYDYESCIGLKVRPKRGDGLLFYSLFPNGTVDPTSLHGSCPVVKGEKWVATKWITRDNDQKE